MPRRHESATIERLKYLALPRQRKIFEIRSDVFQRVRHFLNERKFIEVHLPSIVSVSTDPVKDPTKELFRLKYYGEDAYLIQSVQLHKQMLMAVGFSKIYSLAQFWRDNELVTPRHSVESWGLDVEMANTRNEDDAMSLLEEIIINSVNSIKQAYPNVVSNKKLVTFPILRLSYDELIEILKRNRVKIEWGEDPGYEREKKLGEIMLLRGVNIFFVTHYPAVVKKFYTKLKDDKNYTATFDLIYDGWEIASGAQRETNLVTLTNRLQEKGLRLKDYEDFLDIFRVGVPEHGGFCLGIDRVIARLLDLKSVEDVIFFPRNPGKLRP